MPLFLLLAAPGSIYRRACSLTRLANTLVSERLQGSCDTTITYHKCPTNRRHPFVSTPISPCLGFKSRCGRRPVPAALCYPRLEGLVDKSRLYHSTQPSDHDELPEDTLDAYISDLTAEDDAAEITEPRTQVQFSNGPFYPQATRSRRKAWRESRPATVLASLDDESKGIYVISPPGKKDLSYTSLHGSGYRNPVHHLPLQEPERQLRDPVSLYSILARYLHHHAALPSIAEDFVYTPLELHLLASHGYSPESVGNWAWCLTEPRSRAAAKPFESGSETPPLFLLLLFLRRKSIRVSTLTIIMTHVESRLKDQPIAWGTLKFLLIRLVRHARLSWPESMPLIASLFTTEAGRLVYKRDKATSHPPSLVELTRFCNTFLWLLSLSTSIGPIRSAKFQEKAQFTVLQYMASCSPAIVVTDLGFQAVAKNQLAHAKTKQEREWAELKGPSWPPWKENRTAMDEDKGYEFGASRASKILHRMFDAGYGGNYTTDLAQIYAGWDVDASPTIQTRTMWPGFQEQLWGVLIRRAHLWAGRIRTTRTAREAWACFLSYEQSNERSHEVVYYAMFGKLSRGTVERAPQGIQSGSKPGDHEDRTTYLLPGDMLEVLPDPVSPLHNVYLSEPVPTFHHLLRRMQVSGVRPSARFLALLLESCPDFESGLDIIEFAKDDPDDATARLAAGIHLDDQIIQSMPGYLFTAFIRLLCRFGRYDRPHVHSVAFLTTSEHQHRFSSDRQYLLEYAYMLLMHYRPRYRPAWHAYMQMLIQTKRGWLAGNVNRYGIICKFVDEMDRLDLDIEDRTFSLVCAATTFAAQSVEQRHASPEDERYILANSSTRLRTLFNELVLASVASHPATTLPVPTHIPGPAQLHAYVRALGMFRDFEGLYSFSTWLTKHHVKVTARAEAQHSGSKTLFRTIVALRVAVDGTDRRPGAPADIAQLIRMQIEGVEEWGGWPEQKYVDMYHQGHLKSAKPVVGGR